MTDVATQSRTHLASYLRPGRNDHLVMQRLVSEGHAFGTGLVIDPALMQRQADLVETAAQRGLETVLDPRSMDLASEFAFAQSGVSDLPWAPSRPQTPEDLEGVSGLLFAESLGEFVVKESLGAVLAPTHIVTRRDRAWLDVDAALVGHLRRALDSRGRAATPVYYPLAVHSTDIADPEFRDRLVQHLAGLAIDAIWLRIHPFGTATAGPLSLRRYLAITQDLHRLGIPLVAEHSGTVGLALMAFGAVGGIESGITYGETYKLDRFMKPRAGTGFSPPPRVYLHRLGEFLNRAPARSFFDHRGNRSAFGCPDQERCCQRGYEDMIEEPRRHFVIQRSAEVRRLAAVPTALRPTTYMDDFLRPASDAAVRAAKALPALRKTSQRLDSWRGTLGAILDETPPASFARPPTGRLSRLPGD